jgi:endonuclease-3
MQLVLAFDERSRVLAKIHGRLRQRFGPQGPWLLLDPVSQLVLGILGTRTRGEISKTAFEALIVRYSRWEAARDASVAELRGIIAEVTYPDVQAPRLKAALQAVTASTGGLTLDHLSGLTVEHALVWLERLPGVGRKIAAATLNFSVLRKVALVIDTHHLRVLRRLGLVDRGADAAEAYDRLMPVLPGGWTAADLDEHHQLMKALGQEICRHAHPLCHRCPLHDLCPSIGSGGHRLFNEPSRLSSVHKQRRINDLSEQDRDSARALREMSAEHPETAATAGRPGKSEFRYMARHASAGRIRSDPAGAARASGHADRTSRRPGLNSPEAPR